MKSGEAVEIEVQRAKERYYKKVKFDEWKSESQQYSQLEDLRKQMSDRFETQEASQAEVRGSQAPEIVPVR